MKTFTADPEQGRDSKGETAVVLDRKEGQRLVDMLNYAASKNKKKRTWTAIAKDLNNRLCCY